MRPLVLHSKDVLCAPANAVTHLEVEQCECLEVLQAVALLHCGEQDGVVGKLAQRPPIGGEVHAL